MQAGEAGEETGVATLQSLVPIYQIQGAGHTSGLKDATVTTSGIVAARASNGFYLQDPEGDDDIATSDGIFIFTGAAPAADIVGAEVQVTGLLRVDVDGGGGFQDLAVLQGTTGLDLAALVDSGALVVD
jgi:hypothetical protein